MYVWQKKKKIHTCVSIQRRSSAVVAPDLVLASSLTTFFQVCACLSNYRSVGRSIESSRHCKVVGNPINYDNWFVHYHCHCYIFTTQCYTERGYATVSHLSVCPSVCLSVTLRYVFHTGSNTLKIISQPNSLRLPLVTPSKIRVE